MANKSAKSIQQLISQEQLRIAEIEEKLRTQTYFKTMPEYGPTYQYCYTTSNREIPYSEQSVDDWIRATIKHLGLRRYGHGGQTTKAILISIPDNLTEDNFEQWLSYQTEKIRKKATPRTRKKNKDV